MPKGTFNLKSDLMKIDESFFEPMTFGELMIGQKFICFPLPILGLLGLRDTYTIFVKTHQNIIGATLISPNSIHYRKAKSNSASTDYFDNSMPIILVE